MMMGLKMGGGGHLFHYCREGTPSKAARLPRRLVRSRERKTQVMRVEETEFELSDSSCKL